MNRRRLCVLAAATGFFAALSFAESLRAQDAPAQPPGVEVEARGPIHEAFAAPADIQPTQGPLVAKPPPDPIDEVPPDQKPDGDNVQWIPGYWSFDVDQKDYVWVSGFWRDVPPGRRWVPGHWQEVDSGWVWVSGYWAPENLQEVQYLPAPPPSVDEGPSVPAPDPDSAYLAGTWVYDGGRYLWRPGHWVKNEPGWVWVPARYVWTPVGYIFVDGFWDHPLDERGLLFAPVRFDLGVWGRRPYVPDYVVPSDFLLSSLFVGPGRHHYYFGDYFEDGYTKRGYVPWFDYHPHKGLYDPNYEYYRRQHAADPRWEQSMRELYRARTAGEVPRPPHTLVQQTKVLREHTVNKTTNVQVNKVVHLTHAQNVTALTPLKEIHKTPVTNLHALGGPSKVPPRVVRVAPVPKEEHAREIKAATVVRQVGQQRREADARALQQGGVPVKHTDPARPVKVELPKPPPRVTPQPAPRKVVPHAPTPPAHVERPIPKYEPKPPPGPPKKK